MFSPFQSAPQALTFVPRELNQVGSNIELLHKRICVGNVVPIHQASELRERAFVSTGPQIVWSNGTDETASLGVSRRCTGEPGDVRRLKW